VAWGGNVGKLTGIKKKKIKNPKGGRKRRYPKERHGTSNKIKNYTRGGQHSVERINDDEERIAKVW